MPDFDAGPADALFTRAPLTVIAATPEARGDAETAARLAALPVMAALDWQAVTAEAELRFAGPVLAVTDGAEEGALAAALPVLRAAAEASGVGLVVALDWDRTDLVAAALLGSGAHLLCEVAVDGWVGPLMVAAAGLSRGAEDPAGGTSARVAQLSEEVARIAEALAELARRAPAGGAVSDRKREYRAAGGGEPPAVTAAELRAAIRSRRLRDEVFGPGWFEDPAWDMLLDLLAAELEGTQVAISSLCIAAAVAPTTALRQIGRMVEAGLLERRPDPGDRRRAFMQLTPGARDALARYFGQVKRAGLPIA